ncbi:hypothetical protein [Erwinia tasmaniensis]|uniref:hypothetical protein n=1 Tax=Erwinia tasmaniensis TaxID=338565 RepID=UPI003A4E6342
MPLLTIKLKTAGSIFISQSPEVTIGPVGSEVYQSVMGMTTEQWIALDAVQIFPETLDEHGGQLSEEMVLNIPRPDAKGQPIAVLITDIAGREAPEVSGTNYQFLYAGDEAEVLNENGICIEHIK